MEKDPIICTCLEIKQSTIESAIKEKNLQTIEEVQNETEAGTVCGGCVDDIYKILEKINGSVKL
ncbi:MAG: (2Fe-2S)-binding protein [Bacteroidetes bacterium]|nr:(2Fe-2S)-binding protein [Bacteroidota bacterium]